MNKDMRKIRAMPKLDARLNIILDSELLDALQDEARNRQCSASAIVRLALLKELNKLS